MNNQIQCAAEVHGDCFGSLCMQTGQCSYKPCRSELSNEEHDAVTKPQPKDMVLVPREPTPEMLAAGNLPWENDADLDQCYRAMLAAAQAPAPAPTGQQVVDALREAMAKADVPQSFRADLIGYFCNGWNELVQAPATAPSGETGEKWEADVECITDESGTDYSVSIRGPGLRNPDYSDVWMKKRPAEQLANWLNTSVLPRFNVQAPAVAQQVPPGWVFEKQAEPLEGHLRIQDPKGRFVYIGAECLDTTEKMLFDLATAIFDVPVQGSGS